jgi:alpha-ribazole phosphatase
MKLYLVRHGEVEAGKGRVVGHLDLPLSAEGTRHISALANTWLGAPPSLFFASDLRRSIDSAALLAARLGRVPETDPRLRELSFGHWEGATWDEIYRRDRERLAAWGERWWEVAPPGGETFTNLSRRVLDWFADLEPRTEESTVVLVVAHGGSLRALLGALLGISHARLFELRLDCAHVSALVATQQIRELLFLNRDRFGLV